jgi:CBS domain containing-hemolysin-like protein
MLLWLFCMTLLLLASAFFSASEAAMFSLRKTPRGPIEHLDDSQRTGVQLIVENLLKNPERLLTAVLFWNLLMNLGYFTIGSIVSLNLRHSSPTLAGVFAIAALLVIILFGEMLPKSLAVLMPESLGLWIARPLSLAVRLVDPLERFFKVAALLSRRLVWPGFEPEPYLNVRDLERAVQLSGGDASLVEQEQRVLERIVQLSDVRAEELMRPRTQFQSFRPPVTLADLAARTFYGNYLLVTEPDSEEIAGAIALDDLWRVPDGPLDRIVEPVIYVPWSTHAADVLELIRRGKREVAAVINEFGETIGILTFDDILDTIFSAAPSRSERLMRREAIRLVSPGIWHVGGMTSLRRLARSFRVPMPEMKSVTVAGVLQEVLGRMPERGDEGQFDGFKFKVLDAPRRGQLIVELTLARDGEPQR